MKFRAVAAVAWRRVRRTRTCCCCWRKRCRRRQDASPATHVWHLLVTKPRSTYIYICCSSLPVSDDSAFEVAWPPAFGVHKNVLYRSMALPFYLFLHKLRPKSLEQHCLLAGLASVFNSTLRGIILLLLVCLEAWISCFQINQKPPIWQNY